MHCLGSLYRATSSWSPTLSSSSVVSGPGPGLLVFYLSSIDNRTAGHRVEPLEGVVSTAPQRWVENVFMCWCVENVEYCVTTVARCPTYCLRRIASRRRDASCADVWLHHPSRYKQRRDSHGLPLVFFELLVLRWRNTVGAFACRERFQTSGRFFLLRKALFSYAFSLIFSSSSSRSTESVRKILYDKTTKNTLNISQSQHRLLQWYYLEFEVSFLGEAVPPPLHPASLTASLATSRSRGGAKEEKLRRRRPSWSSTSWTRPTPLGRLLFNNSAVCVQTNWTELSLFYYILYMYINFNNNTVHFILSYLPCLIVRLNNNK